MRICGGTSSQRSGVGEFKVRPTYISRVKATGPMPARAATADLSSGCIPPVLKFTNVALNQVRPSAKLYKKSDRTSIGGRSIGYGARVGLKLHVAVPRRDRPRASSVNGHFQLVVPSVRRSLNKLIRRIQQWRGVIASSNNHFDTETVCAELRDTY